MENLAAELGGASAPSDSKSSWISAGGNTLNSLINIAGQYFLNRQAMNNQKELFDYQAKYNAPVNEAVRLRAAGLTEAAIAQHLAGIQSTQNMPVASHSPAPALATSLGDSFVNAKRTAAETLERDTASQEHNKAIELMEQQRFWNDRLFFMQIQESISRVLHNNALSSMTRAQTSLFLEEAETLRSKRPWEIDTLKAGLYKIQQDINESRSREFYNYESGKTQPYLRNLYTSESEFNYSKKFNEDQRGFELLFENDLRMHGWNPNSPFWQNVGRLSVTHPKDASRLIDNFELFLGDLDNRCKETFGNHYKRNVGIGAGLYLLNRHIENGKDHALRRLNSLTSILGNVIPFAQPSQPVSNYYQGWTPSF